MTHRIRVGLAAAIVVATWNSSVSAQPPNAGAGRPVVSGEGAVSLERLPTVLQMRIGLTGRGKDMQEALDKLDDRREAARLLLKSLAVDMDTVKFSDPNTADVESDQRSRFEAMVRERVRASGRDTPQGLKIPKSVAVGTSLTARWPISGTTVEERLIETESLREKIEAADIAGMKEAKELTPEELELMEELQANMPRYSSSRQEELPGTPSFSYVASISQEERDEALAEAFQKAKRSAARLAAAAGAELGPLAHLSLIGDAESSGGYGGYHYGYSPRQRSWVQFLPGAGKDSNEAFGETFGPIQFSFGVRAVFCIKTDEQP